MACFLIDLGVFLPSVTHLASEKSILPNFSMLRGVAILDCDSHSQAGSTKEEKRREEERRGRGENSRRQEKGCRDERPLYESIYSLAGSPGGICPPTKSTLDQLHPLQLQVAPHLSTFISKLLTLHKKGDYSSHPLIFVQFMPVCSC